MKKIMMIFAVLFTMVGSSLGDRVSNLRVEHLRVRTWTAYVKFSGCSHYAEISLNDTYGKAMYATALSAFNSGSTVEVDFVDSDNCQTRESTLRYIDLYK